MYLVVCAVLTLFFGFGQTYTCDSEFGIDISDGKIIDNDIVIKNDVLYTPKNYKEVNGVKTGCICDIRVCVRKCCPIGQYMANATCVDTDNPFIIPEKNRPDLNGYQFIYGHKCQHKKRRTILDPSWSSDQDFMITEQGKLFVPFEDVIFKLQDYCVDYIEEFDEIKALVCDYKNANISDANIIGMMISMLFLLLTFIVYAILPERSMHMKVLMSYVITLFGAYLFLCIAQIIPNSLEFETCKALAILCIFCFMVSFLLINVMSFDMWWTFSGLRGLTGTKKQKENKRFLLYSAYAWGVPLLFIIIVMSLTHSGAIPIDAWYHPGIGESRCWFKDNVSSLLYFHSPVAVSIAFNMIMFCITALKIKQMQKDTEMLTRDDGKKSSYERDKKKYYLFIKLMLAMGMNWSLEIISWAVNWQVGYVPKYVWYITDFCNALYGMFIFFMFVFKRNIWNMVKLRYFALSGKKLLNTSVMDRRESNQSRSQ